MARRSKFSAGVRERAVRMVLAHRAGVTSDGRARVNEPLGLLASEIATPGIVQSKMVGSVRSSGDSVAAQLNRLEKVREQGDVNE
jgi:hypothetical protein